jgi:hypothetical protein
MRQCACPTGLIGLFVKRVTGRNCLPSVIHIFAFALVVCVAALTGCAPSYLIASQLNYLTYDRPFTDATAHSVRKDAEKQCRERGMVAIMTSDTCSLTRCITNFECVTRADDKEYRL